MRYLLTVLFLISLVIVAAQDMRNKPQNETSDDFEKLTFNVSLPKERYYPLESVFVTFSLMNDTATRLSTYNPIFEIEAKLKLLTAEGTRVFDLPSAASGIPMRFPMFLEQGNSLKKTVGLDIVRTEIVPSPWEYEVQFVLSNSTKTSSLESNTVRILVAEPQGINRDAYIALRKHSKYLGSFSWAFVEKDGERLLEKFVREHWASEYGELAIYNLGLIYKSKGAFDKAESQFERIKSSQNEHIADLAKKSLVELKKKR